MHFQHARTRFQEDWMQPEQARMHTDPWTVWWDSGALNISNGAAAVSSKNCI
jgi:hypothetical protein